jgi:hypothetical protein
VAEAAVVLTREAVNAVPVKFPEKLVAIKVEVLTT